MSVPRSKRQLRVPIAVALAATLQFAPAAPASDYRVPTGFNGHEWGEAFAELPGIKLWHANTARGGQGLATDYQLHCIQTTTSECDPVLSSTDQTIESAGSFALAEYYLNVDSNPWASSGVKLYTISYLYCASSRNDYVPSPIKKHLRLCGSRVIFKSDALAELAKRSEGFQSNFDRIVHRLIADYGEPPGYELHGKITIQSATGDDITSTATPDKPEYVVYRWCGVPLPLRHVRPECNATVTLEFEATHGVGTVLLATPEVYDFAYAIHGVGDQNNDLYRLLYNHRLDQTEPRLVERCTGKRTCNPTHAQMTAREMRDFAP